MFVDINMCRDFEYYVDVLSKEVVELGTKKYPYKNLKSVFVEVLYLHSNQPHHVKVYIKEETSNYLYLDENHIVNMTKLEVTTYAKGSTESGRALIIGTDDKSKKSVLVTTSMFKVLITDELSASKALSQYKNYSSIELFTLIEGSDVLHIIKANVTMDKINFMSEHAIEPQSHTFIKLTNSKGTWLELSNGYVDVSGYFVEALEQSNFRFDSIVFDSYRVSRIVYYEELCTDPTELYESEFHANNITITISKRPVGGLKYLFFLALGGNVYLSNIYIAASPFGGYIIFFPYLVED